MMDLLFNGVGWTDIALTLNRIAVGAFFMHSGYHKLFNAERHRTFVDELKALGVPCAGLQSMVGAVGRVLRRRLPSLSGSWRRSPRLASLSSFSSPSPLRGGSGSNFTSRSIGEIASTIGSIYRRRFMPLC